MPSIQIDPSCIVETAYGLPSSVLENLYAEECDERYGWDWRLVPTPGLTVFSGFVGTKARGTFQSDAVGGGQIIAVHDTIVRRVTSAGTTVLLTGSATDDNLPVAFASSQTQLGLNSGGDVYQVTSSAITDFTANLVAAGASGDIIDIAVVNNRHLFAEDNSGRIFYSTAGAITTIAGFFTAERDPDQIRALLVVSGNIMALGTRKTEFWTATGSSTEPFIQRQGYVLEHGIIGSRARCQIGGAGYWISHDHTFRRWAGTGAENIGPKWLTRMIAGLSEANKALVRLTAHSWIANDFVKIFIPGRGSFFFNASNGQWHRRRDLGDELVTDWSFDYFVEAYGELFVQKLSTGQLYKLDEAVFTEDSISVRRVASALVPIKNIIPITNVVVEGQAGVGLDGSGVPENDDPEIMMRVAYDGIIFAKELRANIGRIAQYKWRAIFGSQGEFRPPIVKVELAYSAAVGYAIYGLTYNEEVA